MRVLGSIFGALGIGLITLDLLAMMGIEFGSVRLTPGEAAFLLPFFGFFLRVWYLVWHRWSPLAIRHVVANVFFFLTLFLIYWSLYLGGWIWGYFSVAALIAICYVLHLVITVVLSRHAFPPSSGPEPHLP